MNVSVVIPLYNKAEHIGRALDSVAAQTLAPTQVIVVDDGSTDGGADIVAGLEGRFGGRLRLIRQANAGVSVARNTGVAASAGDFVAFLDADDEWKPRHLDTMAALSVRYPDAGGYAANHEVVSSDGVVSNPRLRGLPPAPWEGVIPNFFRAMSIESNPVWTSSFVVRRAVLTDVGGFPPGVKKGQDKDLWVRIGLRYPIAFTWKVGAVYHRDAENRSDVHSLEEDRHYCRTLEHELNAGQVSPGVSADVREFIAETRLYLADKYLRLGDRATARRILSRVRTRRHLPVLVRYRLRATLPTWLVRAFKRARRSAA